MSSHDLSGAERAAILIMYLDRPVAKNLLSFLDADEIREIGMAMATIESADAELVEDVVSQFLKDLYQASVVPHAGYDFMRKVLPELIDTERRDDVVKGINRRVNKDFERFIASRSPRTVASVLAEEHLQTRAVALALMGSENAAKVMKFATEDDQVELARRMARLKNIPGDMADDICSSLMEALDTFQERLTVGGVDRTARVLGHLQRQDNERVLTSLAMMDVDLAENLRQHMVVFEDLGELDDRSIQTLLKTIDREDLLKSLKGTTPAVRERFISNLSARAADDLREALELLGPVRRVAIAEAQTRIIATAVDLASKGEIYLGILDVEEEG